jgi:hypothetical protein
MADAGTTTIAPSGTLVRDGASTVFLATGRLVEMNGTLDLRTDRLISPSGVPAPLIHNTGTIRKTAGPGTATISTSLENDGVVLSDSGTLDVRGGDGAGTSSGALGAAPAAGSITLGAGAFDLAQGAGLFGGVTVNGADLDVVGAATATASGANTLTSGRIGGAGQLDVTGTLTWTGGSMTEQGTTRIAPSATLVREGANTVFLETGRLLQVDGTFDLRTDRTISPSGLPAPLIRNTGTGTVRKSAGPGTATVSVALENDGAVLSDSGILDLRAGDAAGSSAGAFGAPASPGTVSLAAGTFDLAAGARLLGGVDLAGATVNVESAATAVATGANKLSSGQLGGAGTFDVDGTLTWTGGNMRDAGTTVVRAGSNLVQQGFTSLQGTRVLENRGHIDLRGDNSFSSLSGTPVVRNIGSLEKTTGAGSTFLSVPIDNDGTVTAAIGTLSLHGGDGSAEQNGTFAGSGTGKVAFSSGNYDLGAGTVLAGRVKIDGGRLIVPAGVTVPASGSNEFAAGSVDGAGTFRIDGPLAWSGGVMDGSGTTLVPAGAELRLTADCCPSLGGTRRLVNHGAIVVDGGELFAQENTSVENNGRLELAGGADGEGMSGSGRLLNAGTIVKSAGPDPSSISLELENTATVTSESGRLELDSGDGTRTQSGSFGGTGGGEVVFADGEWDFGPGSAFTGGVAIEGAEISVPAGATLPVAGSARIDSGGRLLGLGTVEIQGALLWKGGSMEQRGTTAVAPGAVLTIDVDPALGDVVSVSDGRYLFNRGQIRFVRGDLDAPDAAIENAGTVDLQGDSSIDDGFAFAGSLLHNTGTIKKSAGAGISTIRMLVDNDGTFEAASGTLALQGELQNASRRTQSLTAGAYIARNATLELPALLVKVNAATLVLDGATAHIRTRDFFGAPQQDALAILQRNAGAGELRLEGGADLGVPGAFSNAGLLWLGANSTLTVPGTYAQSGGTLAVETAAAANGQLVAGGAATLGGNLSVATRSGFVPAAGTVFRFLDTLSRTGTFASVTELAPGIDYEVDYDATGAALRVVGTTPAPPAAAPRAPAVAVPQPAVVVDDRVLAVLSGPWTRKASPGFYGGTYTMSSKRGARLVRAGIEARQLALLVSTCRGCGSLEAYWNGRLLKRIRLVGRPSRKLVDLTNFPSVQTGTLVLRVASRRQVRIDGLVVTR